MRLLSKSLYTWRLVHSKSKMDAIKTPEQGTKSPSSDLHDTTPSKRKLTGRKFYESIGSPKLILAPMVDRSEFVGKGSMIRIALL